MIGRLPIGGLFERQKVNGLESQNPRSMRFFILVLCLILLGGPSLADPVKELHSQIESSSDPSAKAQLWLRLAELKRTTDPGYAASCLVEAERCWVELSEQGGEFPHQKAQEALLQAAAHYQTAGRLPEKFATLTECAALMLQAERRAEAEELLKTVIQEADKSNQGRPQQVQAYRVLASSAESQGHWNEATEIYSRGLYLATTSDPDSVAVIKLHLAALHLTQGRLTRAESFYEQVLESPQSTVAEKAEARISLAETLLRQKRFQLAGESFGELSQEMADTPQGGVMGFKYAYCLQRLGRSQEALQALERLGDSLSHPKLSPEVRNLYLEVLLELGEKEKAERFLASKVFADPLTQADALVTIGQKIRAEQSLNEALPHLTPSEALRATQLLLKLNREGEASKLLESLLDTTQPSADRAAVLVNLAEARFRQGRYEGALALLKEATEWYRQRDSWYGLATCYNNIADCWLQIGEPGQAIDALHESEKIIETKLSQQPTHQVTRLKATVLNALGAFWLSHRDYDQADLYLERAMQERAKGGDVPGAIVTSIAQAQVALGREQSERAAQLLDQALEQAQALDDNALMLEVLITRLYHLDDLEQAEHHFAEAARLDQRSLWGGVLRAGLAQAHYRQGDLTQAAALARIALTNSSSLTISSHCHPILVSHALNKSDTSEALIQYKEMVIRLSEYVGHLTTQESRKRVASHEPLTRTLVAALAREDSPSTMLEVEEQARSLTLQALTTELPLPGQLPTELGQAERRLSAQLRAINSKLGSDPEVAAALTREYRKVLAQIGHQQIRSNLIVQVQPATVERLQGELQADELLLYYIEGPDELYLVTVSQDKVALYKLGSRSAIESLAEKTYESLRRFRPGPKTDQMLTLLGEHLLQPVTGQLANHRDLIIIPPESLHNVPFSALRLGQRYLIQDHQVARSNSSGAWLMSRQSKAKGKGVLLSCLGGLTVARHGEKLFESLPGTTQEVRALQELYPSSSLLAEKEAHSSAMQRLSEGKEIVHYATHGVLNEKEPLLSGLVAADGVVTAASIFNWDLSADLAVISACQSGTFADGKGYLGLSTAFQQAGARTLIASLWSVNDSSTRDWMTAFYQAKEKGETSSQAHRTAHLATLQKYPEPFFWAPFELWGDGFSRNGP